KVDKGSQKDLQILLDKLENILENYGTKLNKNKTKVMSRMNLLNNSKALLFWQIAQGKIIFQSKNHILSTNSEKIDKRNNFLKSYTVSATRKKRLDAFEIWCYQNMLTII
ncbi:LINE-1 reverse transcriptase, partial [Aphis craccivora]